MFDRWFAKKDASDSEGKSSADSVPKRPIDSSASPDVETDLTLPETRIGLCFNFMRGMAYDSVSLSDEGLDEVMAALEAQKLRATFFCSSKLCEAAHEVVRRIAQAGHEIGALGYADEVPTTLPDEALTQLALSCRRSFEKLGIRVNGFRAPKSKWDERLMSVLALQGYVYSAEHDHAHHPYWLQTESKPIIRIPVRTDDRGLRRRGETYDEVVSKHYRVLRKAIQRKCFVTVCFHPWILAESPERMEHWHVWLEQAVHSGARVGALEDALPKSLLEQGSSRNSQTDRGD